LNLKPLAGHLKYQKTRNVAQFPVDFSEILPYNGLGPGPGEVGQGGWKAFHL